MTRNFSNDFGSDDRKIPLSGYYVSDGFFKVFSFNLVEGDRETALKDHYNIVITYKAAEKIFGKTSDLIGEVLLACYDEK